MLDRGQQAFGQRGQRFRFGESLRVAGPGLSLDLFGLGVERMGFHRAGDPG